MQAFRTRSLGSMGFKCVRLKCLGFRVKGFRVSGFRVWGLGFTWRPRGLSKWVVSRAIRTLNGVTLII